MPGVLIIESMAQAGGFMLMNRVEDKEGKLLLFSGIQEAKFRRPVRPGDQMVIEMKLLRWGGKLVKMSGIASVDDKIVAQAILYATLVERKDMP